MPSSTSPAQQPKKKKPRLRTKGARKAVVDSYPSHAVRTVSPVAPPSLVRKVRPTPQEQLDNGKIAFTQSHYRTYWAISFQERYECPDESEWPQLIRELQSETGGDVRTIRYVFERCRDGDASCLEHKKGAGRPMKLERDNEGLIAAAMALNVGVPPSLATEVCNTVNERNARASGITDDNQLLELRVCRKTVMNSLAKYTNMDQSAILRRKTGSKDENSAWARARLLFAKQLKMQFQLGDDIRAGNITIEDCGELQPLFMDGLLQVDESHSKCIIAGAGHGGAGSNIQYRISVDEETGALLPISQGGKMPEKRRRVVPKYGKEARGCFGVACPIYNGVQMPQMMTPWNYTECTLLSAKRANEKIKRTNSAYREWKGQDAAAWKDFKEFSEPFKARYTDYPEQWWDEMKKVPRWKKHMDIRDMIRHIIAEGNRIFASTEHANSWMIYHDHLKILWEKETIDWLQTQECPTESDPDRTWYDRFVKLEASFNDDAPASYKNKLPGDSPELMSLDNHLFADVEEALAKNIAFSFYLPEGHEMKYSASTPNRLWAAIIKTLETNAVPKPERIKEDMYRIKNETLDRIIASHGTYIEDSVKGKKTRKGIRGQMVLEHRRKNREKLSTLDDDLVSSMLTLHEKVGNGEQRIPLVLEELISDDEVSVDESIVYSEDENDDVV